MGADEGIRARVSGIAAPELGDTPMACAPELARARVAIVTTAGLRPRGDVQLWPFGDTSFVALAGDARDLQLSHVSSNFDRSGIAADLNVAYPIDRLAELAAGGVIGSVASRHYSFMGAQPDHTLATFRLDTGPAVAAALRDDGVDVVLLTPV